MRSEGGGRWNGKGQGILLVVLRIIFRIGLGGMGQDGQNVNLHSVQTYNFIPSTPVPVAYLPSR